MTLKDILVISGHSGLSRYISRGRSSVIVENLVNGKRTSITTTTRISMLEDIIVFTTGEDMSLHTVLGRMLAWHKGSAAPSHKAPDAELLAYFAEVLPEYNRERVYVSDIRKIVQWYNLLLSLGITEFDPPKTDSAEASATAKNEPADSAETSATARAETADSAEAPATARNETADSAEASATARNETADSAEASATARDETAGDNENK